MKRPSITQDKITKLYENRFLRLYSMDFGTGHPYYQASRRDTGELVVLRSDDEFKCMYPDAVTCILVLKTPEQPPRLYMEREYRYPAGRFLLSPPAGLLDPEDKDGRSVSQALAAAAKREIFEETGVRLKETDKITVVSEFFMSSPGMSDESNGMIAAEAELSDLSCLTDSGAVGGECFDGFRLYTKEQAEKLLLSCRDDDGAPFSIYTWCALSWFCRNY